MKPGAAGGGEREVLTLNLLQCTGYSTSLYTSVRFLTIAELEFGKMYLLLRLIVADITLPRPVRCPECTSVDVRRSYPKGWRDAVMIHIGIRPLRCRECEHRFYKRLQPDEKLGRPDISMEKAPIL
jgi:hypothetical protein